MTAVWLDCETQMELQRKKQGDKFQVKDGRFDLPPGQVLTLVSPHIAKYVTVQALEASVLVNGEVLVGGDKRRLRVDNFVSVELRAQ